MHKIDSKVLEAAIAKVEANQKYKKFEDLLLQRLKKFSKNKTFTYYKEKDEIQKDGTSKRIEVEEKKAIESNSAFEKYLTYLTSNIHSIITCNIEKFEMHRKAFSQFDFSKEDVDVVKGFKKRILQILQYDKFRSGEGKILFNFFESLNVKACVYCNSQHVILIKNSKIARLQADHNLPKSDYPEFSITLANLYPTCNNCNHLKKETDIKYSLYSDTQLKSDLKFEIDDYDLVQTLILPGRTNKIELKFNQGSSKINEVLDIEGIYKNHLDIVQTMLWRSRIYTSDYIDKLNKIVNLSDKDEIDYINIITYGTPLRHSLINNNVFAKLKIDIMQQIDPSKILD